MPWFDTPATNSGNWGSHWTMKNRNPDVIDSDGKRQIASHYYPLIGPYASSDAAIIEWQQRLMKTAGFDGILIDWYGIAGTNGDLSKLMINSDAIVNGISSSGMSFAVVMEDNFWADTSTARSNLLFLNNTYFRNPAYARGEAL